jgi:hypothetical protein
MCLLEHLLAHSFEHLNDCLSFGIVLGVGLEQERGGGEEDAEGFRVCGLRAAVHLIYEWNEGSALKPVADSTVVAREQQVAQHPFPPEGMLVQLDYLVSCQPAEGQLVHMQVLLLLLHLPQKFTLQLAQQLRLVLFGHVGEVLQHCLEYLRIQGEALLE